MKEYLINVNFNDSTINPEEISLVRNDYNSIKLKFNIDDYSGKLLFKLKYPNNDYYVDEIVNNELILKQGILNVGGIYNAEICIYGVDSRLTNYAILKINVRNDLITSDEIVAIDDRIPALEKMIIELEETLAELDYKVKTGYFNGKDGKAGRDGYKEYSAGSNIDITDDVISANINLSNYYTKSETDAKISDAIGDALEGDY